LQERAAKKLDPHRCVAIEDSLWGLESARQAGLRCVGVTTSYAAAELPGAELVVEGLHALTLPMLDALVKDGRQ
jgi:sugar-phosphatase